MPFLFWRYIFMKILRLFCWFSNTVSCSCDFLSNTFRIFLTQTSFPGLSYLIHLRSSFLRKESCDREMFTLGQIMNIQGHKIDKNLSIAFGGKNICLTPVKCVANWAKLPQKSSKKIWRSYRKNSKICCSFCHFSSFKNTSTWEEKHAGFSLSWAWPAEINDVPHHVPLLHFGSFCASTMKGLNK